MVEWYGLFGAFLFIAIVTYLGARVALMAFDDVNELMYGEEYMRKVWEK